MQANASAPFPAIATAREPRGRDDVLRDQLRQLAQQYPRFGSPRLKVKPCWLRYSEARYNHKLVERHYRELGLKALRAQETQAFGAGSCAVSTRPERANQEWRNGFCQRRRWPAVRHVRKVLTVVDVFTRECLALETDTSMGSIYV